MTSWKRATLSNGGIESHLRFTRVNFDGTVAGVGPDIPSNMSPREARDGLIWCAYIREYPTELHLLALDEKTLKTVHNALYKLPQLPTQPQRRMTRYRVTIATSFDERIPLVVDVSQRFYQSAAMGSVEESLGDYLLIWDPKIDGFGPRVKLQGNPGSSSYALTKSGNFQAVSHGFGPTAPQVYDSQTGALLSGPTDLTVKNVQWQSPTATRISLVPRSWIPADPKPTWMFAPDLELSTEILFPSNCQPGHNSFIDRIDRSLNGYNGLSPDRDPEGYARLCSRLTHRAAVQSVVISNPDGSAPRVLGGDLAQTAQNSLRGSWSDGSWGAVPEEGPIQIGRYHLARVESGFELDNLNPTDALCIQLVSPTPRAINAGKGIVRLGLINRQSTEVAWRGWFAPPSNTIRNCESGGPIPTDRPNEWLVMWHEASDQSASSSEPLYVARCTALAPIELPTGLEKWVRMHFWSY